jgi:superfamily II DNA or RNA helicase
MPSAVYVFDGEGQIAIRFRTEEERERFKAHYRLMDALGVQFRDERDQAREEAARLRDALRWAVAMLDTADQTGCMIMAEWREWRDETARPALLGKVA